MGVTGNPSKLRWNRWINPGSTANVRRLTAVQCDRSGSISMIGRQAPVFLLLVLSAGIAPTRAQEVVYYEENGVTYRETRQIVRCPVAETKIQESEQTVYRPQWKTESRDVVR